DGAIIVWNLKGKSQVKEFKGQHDGEVTALAFSPGDSNMLVSAGSDQLIKIWSMETNQAFLKIDAGCYVYAIAFSPNGNVVYAAGDDNLIRRWNVADGKPSGVFKGHEAPVVSLIARGDAIISGSLDKTIRIWDAK